MEKKKILIACFKDLRTSQRTYRQIILLKNKYEVYTLGFKNAGIPGVKFFPVLPRFKTMALFEKIYCAVLFLLGAFEIAYNRIYDFKSTRDELKKIKFDLIIVHDLKPMPLVYQIDNSPKILCDAHEYYYDTVTMDMINYLLHGLDKFLIKKYFLKLRHITTVSNWIAEQYRMLIPGAQIDVITSASKFYDLQPSPAKKDKIRIIYHGLADYKRKIELSIQTMDYLDERFELDLMLTTTAFNEPYYNQLKELCKNRPRVRIIPAVDAHEIVPFTNQYDIGLFLHPNTYLSHAYALSNKFFEFIQARLMIAIGPNHEMGRIVKEKNLGVVADNFEPAEMAKLLNALSTEQIMQYKNQSDKCAAQLSAEQEMKKLDTIIERLLN